MNNPQALSADQHTASTVAPPTVDVDVQPIPEEERAQAGRDREQALRDPDRYYRAVHVAFVRQRRDRVAPVARPQTRRRGAGRPAARRTGASSATSGSDPGGSDDEPAGPPAAALDAVATAWTASLRRRRPDHSWEVRP